MTSSRAVLSLAVASLGLAIGCRPQAADPVMPSGIRFVSRADWGAREPVLPMRKHVPVRLTIHHTGTPSAASRSLESKILGLQRFSQRADSLAGGRKKPAWADVPYHFYVSIDGAVAEAREWEYVGDSNTPYDPTGHLLVVFEGNFEQETLSSAQRRTLDVLIPALARHFRIDSRAVGGHRDYARTSCPGRDLYAELPRLRELVRAATR